MRIEELKESEKKFGQFYPVLKDKDGNIIDGFHRKKVDPNWIEIKLENVDTPLKREILALITNIDRREIHSDEISKRIEKILNLDKERYFNENKWNLRLLAEDLARSYEWVLKYTPQKFKSEIQVRHALAVRHTAENDTNDTNDTLKQTDVMPEFSIKQPKEGKLYNIWEATEKRLEGYGDKNFHGNTSPDLLKEVLLKYSNENDTIIDIMAGSGTSIDLCKELNRKCIAFDIKPLREDIKKQDAEKTGLENNSIDFCFAHFPYWNMVKYSEEKEDLSNLQLHNFFDKTKRIFKEIKRILKSNCFFAVLIGDLRRKREIIDLSARFSLYGSEEFSLYDKIIWRNLHQRSLTNVYGSISKWRAEKYNFHLPTFDTLLVFKKVK